MSIMHYVNDNDNKFVSSEIHLKYQWPNSDTTVGVFKSENEHLEFKLNLCCYGHTNFEAKPTI